MQDTKNLIKKRDVEYPKIIREALSKGDTYTANYWRGQLESVKNRINRRMKNKKKNEKQFRKAN